MYFLILMLSLLLPSLVHATTYYVATSGGSDANSCATAQTVGTPKATIGSGKACLASGDTLAIRTGTYNEKLESGLPSGSAGSFTTVTNYNGEVVTLAPSSGNRVLYVTNQSYIKFHGLIIDASNITFDALKIDVGSHHVTFEDGELKNAPNQKVLTDTANNVSILRSSIHGGGTTNLHHGIYIHDGSGHLIEGNDIYDNADNGIQMYPSPSNSTVRRNLIRSNAARGCSGNCSQVVLAGSTHIFEYNIVHTTVNAASPAIQVYLGANSMTVRQNTIYNGGIYGVYIYASAANTKVQNNIVLANSTNISNNSASSTLTTNKTTGSLTDCTVSTSVFTHKSTSSCIDAGTNIGLAFNGAAPDQGAFETMIWASCSVENGDASTLRVTFTNNLNPPLLPASGVTTFTARKAGTNDVIISAVRTGTNRVDLTLTDAMINTDAVDVSYVSGNLTDSALIANSLNQPYVQTLTLQSCVNNVGAGTTHVFTQTVFRFNGLRGTEAAPVATPYASAPENTNILLVPGGKVRLRIGLSCTTADCPPTGFYPYFSRNGGAYAVVPDVFGSDNIAFCGTGPDADIPTSGTATTQQLSGSGMFVPGALVRTSNAIPTIDMALNGRTELEYCLAFDTDVIAGHTFDLRIRKQDGTAIDTYTVTPRATIMPMAGGMGF